MRKNTSQKTLGLYNKFKKRFCAKKRENIFDIKRRKREG